MRLTSYDGRWLWLSVFLVFCFVSPKSFSNQSSNKNQVLHYDVVPGEYIVKFKKSLNLKNSFHRKSVLENTLSDVVIKSAQTFRADDDLVHLKVESNQKPDQFVKRFFKHPLVEYVEPNYVIRAIDINDPDFFRNWGLRNSGGYDVVGNKGVAGSDIDALGAWQISTGNKKVVVAVIDSGVDFHHEDLKENIFINHSEIPGNGIDDDKNGFIDDVNGWNFSDENNNPMDDDRHGTHCAGTIGAVGNNGIGTAGVAWNVSLLPIKFLSAKGSGSTVGAIESIYYAIKMRVNIMSNSWGGGPRSNALFEAIKKAREAGILFVAAAGNEGKNNDRYPTYPASYPVDNIISVAATNNHDLKPRFSNYGKKSVHLGAPGVAIFSTVPTNMGLYGHSSGTSMAAPHVAGAASVLWSVFPNWNYKKIKSRLLNTADPVQSMMRKTVSGGRLNLNNAIRNLKEPLVEPDPKLWKSAIVHYDSAHPYTKERKLVAAIKHPGAKFMRVHFSRLDFEVGYDFVSIVDKLNRVIEDISEASRDYTSEYVQGDLIQVYTEADDVDFRYGFVLDRYDFID